MRKLKRTSTSFLSQTPNQSLLGDNKFTIKELIANEYVQAIGSYDHLIEFSTSNPNRLDYFNNCNNCLDEFLNFLGQLSLKDESKLSFSFTIFIHLFIDLFVNDLKPEAKQFFNNHQHKFSSFDHFKRTFDMLNNSLKNQQLDKRLAKLRCSKVSVSLSESDHKLLLEFLEVGAFSGGASKWPLLTTSFLSAERIAKQKPASNHQPKFLILTISRRRVHQCDLQAIGQRQRPLPSERR